MGYSLKRSVLWVVVGVSAFCKSLGWRACRFEPSCSGYVAQAMARFPLAKALWISFKRILRCHPLCSGGYDPVPSENILKG